MTNAFRIAMAAGGVTLAAGTHRSAFASSQTQTYALHMEVPQVSQAANGDVVSITGEGLFSIHPKTVSANGNFTHSDSQGNVLGSGTWGATQLLSFQPYGCGVVLGFPVPPNLFCIIGPNPPNSHDDESGEGARLDIIGVNNFNKIVSGGNVYIKTKLVLQVASTHLRPAPFASGHASNDRSEERRVGKECRSGW